MIVSCIAVATPRVAGMVAHIDIEVAIGGDIAPGWRRSPPPDRPLQIVPPVSVAETLIQHGDRYAVSELRAVVPATLETVT